MPTLRPFFPRRADLSVEIRLRIASIALLFSVHGTISRLSNKYSISRQFIYNLRRDLKDYGDSHLGREDPKGNVSEKTYSLSWILSMRLEGKSSRLPLASVFINSILYKVSFGTCVLHARNPISKIRNILRELKDIM